MRKIVGIVPHCSATREGKVITIADIRVQRIQCMDCGGRQLGKRTAA